MYKMSTVAWNASVARRCKMLKNIKDRYNIMRSMIDINREATAQ